jgi:(p)ppGpp synthase/HD superfamily hydrolase
MPEENRKPTRLTARFEDALVYATQLHSGQNRKRSDVPYIAHLLAVTALVLEDGGDEDQAIAALLHDAVEDQGGLATLEEIRRRYGNSVAAIVEGCTDAYSIPKPPWRERKESYIASLHGADPAVRRVSLADKVHNARSTLRDLTRDGETVWTRFNGGKEGTLWYYHQLIDAFNEFGSTYLLDVFKRTVSDIERISTNN